MHDVETLIPGLVTYALAPGTRAVVDHPVDEAVWSALVPRCDRDGLLLVLDHAVLAGDLPVTDRQGVQLAEIAVRRAGAIVRVERVLAEVVDLLASAGCDVAVLKGIPNGSRFWPDPEMRMVRDVDLLVPSGQIDRIVGLLEHAGAVRLVPELRSGFDRRFGKAVTLRTVDGVELDVHRTLVYGPHAFLVDEDSLWAQVTADIEIGGTTVRCFSPQAAFVHGCLHAVSGGGATRSSDLVDILAIAQHEALSIEAVAPVARSWLATAAVLEACDAAVSLSTGDAIETLRADLMATPLERRIQATYGGGPSARALALGTVGSIPGVRAKAAYLAALAWPSRANLRARHLDRRAHLSSVLPRRFRR